VAAKLAAEEQAKKKIDEEVGLAADEGKEKEEITDFNFVCQDEVTTNTEDETKQTERKRMEEGAVAAELAVEETRRLDAEAAEEVKKQKMLEEEAKKLAAEEDAIRKAEEEEAARMEAAEEAKLRAAAEEEAKIDAEEEEGNKIVEAAAAAAATAREARAVVIPSNDSTAPAVTTEETKESKVSVIDTTPEAEPEKIRRRDPIEDMFDLTKPIPRVERPNKANHESALTETNEQIESTITQKKKVQTQIDILMDAGYLSELKHSRDELAKVRAAKGALIGQKRDIRSSLNVLRNKGDKLFSDKQKVDVRFRSIGEIETEVERLRKIQETTTMTLSAEKKLIKEIEVLQLSKKSVENLLVMESDLKDIQGQRGDIYEKLNTKDKELDDMQLEIEAKMQVVLELSKKQDTHREEIKHLFSTRDELNKEISRLIKQRDSLRTEFRENNNQWQLYQRAIRAQKRMAYEEERRKHEEEVTAWRRRKEDEEMRKTPYEEEMILCDYLVDYLVRTFLKPTQSKKLEQKQQDSGSTSTDNPFFAMKPYEKGEDVFTSTTRGKNKKRRKRRDATKLKPNTPFVLNIDTYEQFGLLGLDPPASLEHVEASVTELKAKCTWYSKQPRGSVPTAAEIRQKREKARRAKILRAQQKHNSTLSQNDFVPLVAGASEPPTRPVLTTGLSWGQVVTSSPSVTPRVDGVNLPTSQQNQYDQLEIHVEQSQATVVGGDDDDEVDLLLAQLRDSGI